MSPKRPLALTVLYHADLARLGERALLEACDAGGEVSLSRLEPVFGHAAPLADPFLSRRPIALRGRAGGLQVSPASDGNPVCIEGEPLRAPRHISDAELDRGVVVELGDRAVLLLHRLATPDRPAPAALGMVGSSHALDLVRWQIADLAAGDIPVLVTGETGTGKELVAQAIHQTSRRARGPCVVVSLGALTQSTAGSELFGHTRGSFTGAHADHAGHFSRAHGGTLFLDEVGEAPVELQVSLLRALESGEIAPLGGRPERVDVRLISATDADLEAATATGRFREALFHRLAGYQIRIPPLRERPEDVPALLFHFLRAELRALGAEARLQQSANAERLWMPAALVGRLVRHPWPGNVRQLRNAARQIALSSRNAAEAQLSTPEPVRPPEPTAPVPALRKVPAEISDDELVAVLRHNGWSPGSSARELGISRTTLYGLIERSPSLRKAKQLGREELVACLAECGDDLEAVAMKFEVSARGLKLRLRELGLQTH